MNSRAFPVVKIERESGIDIFAEKVECADCEAVAYHTTRKGLAPIVAEKYFRSLGWTIGNGPRRDKCPACQSRKPDLKVVKMEAVKAERPREMSRDDRRIITMKLDEVYLEGRYQPPWTDAAVSRDLSVPRVWVAEVRDQFFGPEGSNPDYDAFLEQAAPIIADLKNLHKSVAAQLEQARVIATRVDELERMSRKIEKEIGK